MVGKSFLQDCRHNLELPEMGDLTLVLNAQEMDAVVSGGLGGLACCSIAGQVILFGACERFHIHCSHGQSKTRGKKQREKILLAIPALHELCLMFWDVSCSLVWD